MATFTVTNPLDSGAGSFRQAIFDANTQAGTDEIVFDTGGFPSTLTLTSGELKITDSVNILGSGADWLTVSGNNNSRIFNIDDGGSQILDVLISGLTLTDGNGRATNSNSSFGLGGAIYNADENLTLIDAVVTNNTARGNFFEDGSGGGIFNSSGELTITNSIISSNLAAGQFEYSPGYGTNGSGGGIFNESGTIDVNNSTISDNRAAGGDGYGDSGNGEGGAIFNGSGIINVNNSTISNNSAAAGSGRSFAGHGKGGGMFNGSGELVVTNSTINNNIAAGGSSFYGAAKGSGGGIFGKVTVINSTISDNTARAGSTGSYYSPSYPTTGNGGGISGQVTVINSTISHNTAEGGSGLYGAAGGIGGGIWGSGTVTNSTITGNEAKSGSCHLPYCETDFSFGGGIANTGRMTITSSLIAGNIDAADISGSSFISGGHNLIGNGDGTPGFINGVNNDQVGTTDNPIDPLLGLLQNNGSSTATHALLPGSPAIDAGSNPLMLLTDQRGDGFNRTVGSQTDVGAFEVQPLPSTSVPEPSSMLGLIGLMILGTTCLVKRKLPNKS
ncbi:MAG: choice-of-anchor Q domain-containing protein [Coleofasciculus sp. B1-GNL1-01]|uniref:choice-of-anchor Q domain-containing protein n=1 Tax=Coleofasciculus sp. B1-GNL1-01 TaxID=3068484 RepID=UPI0032F2DCCC